MIRTLLLLLLSCNVLIITKYVVIAQQQQLEPSIMKVDKIAEKLESETCKGKIQTYKSCRFNDKLEVYEKKSGQTFHILSKVAKGFDIPKGCKVTLFSKIGNTHTILGNSKDSQAIVIKGPKQRYCSESHLDNINGIGIEDDADVSEVVEGFKQFAKVVTSIDKHMRQTDDHMRQTDDHMRQTDDAIRKGILGNSDAIIQNSLTCTYSQKEKFLREFKFQEDNRKQEIKDLIKMKETFNKTTCCVQYAEKAYRKDLFYSDSPSGNGCDPYAVDTPPNAVCVPNYKSFYGKRCTVGEAGKLGKGGDLGGISKENMKKLASAIGVNGITDVECPQVNGKDWLNKKDWLKKDDATKFITSLSANCPNDLFFDRSSKPYFKHELCHRLVTCKNVDDEIGENFKIKCAIKGNSTKTGKEIKKQVTCRFNFDCHLGVYREPICDIVNANVNDIKNGNAVPDPNLIICEDESGQFNSTEKLCLITEEDMPVCAVKRKNSKAQCDAFSHFTPSRPPSRPPSRSPTRGTLLNDVLLNGRRRKLLRNSLKGC